MADISIRDYTSPYGVISLTLQKNSSKIPSGEYSDYLRFRIYNHFTIAPGEADASEVKFNFSTSALSLSSGLMNTGAPPPLLVTQVGAGVSTVVNSTVESDEKAVGLDTDTNSWEWFCLQNDGYGSSGAQDGIIEPRGWCEFKLRILVPSSAQSMDWALYLYLQRS